MRAAVSAGIEARTMRSLSLVACGIVRAESSPNVCQFKLVQLVRNREPRRARACELGCGWRVEDAVVRSVLRSAPASRLEVPLPIAERAVRCPPRIRAPRVVTVENQAARKRLRRAHARRPLSIFPPSLESDSEVRACPVSSMSAPNTSAPSRTKRTERGRRARPVAAPEAFRRYPRAFNHSPVIRPTAKGISRLATERTCGR